MSTYITPTEVKLKSRAVGINLKPNAFLEKLILEAEATIDAYCGFWEKADETQPRLFPTAGEETIPREVADATLVIVEQLYLQGAPTLEGEITEESIGGYSYKKTSVAVELVPERAKLLLKGMRKLTGKINLLTE
ncbi:hypothetical protein IPN35_02035 [Candidatus Peregrinibacteria bacterium]|nr:MAG: hypothetical protein IPN35_02035 [Candidatus Peregrinibacteria bacterium]